ncbi:hypothetical protein IW140_004708 [Coemansia sp. RSA 1813]|nr:hypothetical protein EV178_005393 [Coemansia sp. RSA 1646]KAJ1770395.1 hypothetical protein LPJ74_003202 [Coemansia sp. RSA 1843]KAJ2088211.1 hypothetical protein IW138_004383 [Coemansia sp. RSA 986]KAJ2215746.1 hypothetical protein EV179_001970 [Coemansia sp. RSA 487]KAJ2566917.1 hypothetical protein IW140_004708 [Coemansia sp. RSA 1813]
MSPRVPTAFRPLETTSSVFDVPSTVRRAATAVPSHYSSNELFAQERLMRLSRLEKRWCASQGSGGCLRSDCAAPVPRRSYAPSSYSSSSGSLTRPSSSDMLPASPVDDNDACKELRGIFGYSDHSLPLSSSMRSPSSSSSHSSSHRMSSLSVDGDFGFFPLEEIIVRPGSPISRSGNPMPLDAGFGATY